jgi:hypothetical protein
MTPRDPRIYHCIRAKASDVDLVWGRGYKDGKFWIECK